MFILGVNNDDNAAQDLNDDGLRNDVDGDGLFTLRGVQVLFEHRNDTLVTQYAELFDFDEDGEETTVTLSDVEALFEQYLSADTDEVTTESKGIDGSATTAVLEEQRSIAVTVGNTQNTQITTTVPLLVDGDVVAEREITLEAGETKTVTFQPELSDGEQVTVEVGEVAQPGVEVVILAGAENSAVSSQLAR